MYMGMIERHITPAVCEHGIEIPGYGFMFHVAIPFTAWNLPMLVAGGGREVFIPENWQNASLQTLEQVKDHEWIEAHTGEFPIMIGGYPRTVK